MGPTVRAVCDSCLRSLEFTSGDDLAGSATCPHCGSRVERSGEPGREASTGDEFAMPPASSRPDSVTAREDHRGEPSANRIARFVLGEPLGEGGYGQVFRAYDPHLDRDVALKVLKPNRLGEKAMERFYREARAAARLDHPNIVGLHDAGCDGGRCWIAYQLVPGRTLSLIRDLERPTVDASVRIIRDLALALDHAHGRGVFHRDLKPANVLVDDSGRARLTDFGLARRGDVDSDLTREGTILGTPQYMSPEAAAGRAHQADGRSDVYSLGVILYELICGRKPGDLPTGSPPWRSLRVVTPPTPRSIDRAIPAELDRICMKALAFDPEDRYPTALALAEALNRQIPNRPGRSPTRPRVGRRGLAIGLAVASTVLVLVAGMFYRARSVGRSSSVTPALVAGLEKPEAVARPASPHGPALPVDEAVPAVAEAVQVAPEPTPRPPVPPDRLGRPAVMLLSSKDRKFHLKGTCRIIRGKDEASLVELGTVREALSRHRPCSICLPGLDGTAEAAAKTP